MGKFLISVLKALVVVLILNGIGGYLFTRFDLTEDKRFTLSQAAIDGVEKFNSPVVVDILFGRENSLRILQIESGNHPITGVVRC